MQGRLVHCTAVIQSLFPAVVSSALLNSVTRSVTPDDQHHLKVSLSSLVCYQRLHLFSLDPWRVPSLVLLAPLQRHGSALQCSPVVGRIQARRFFYLALSVLL